MKFSELPDLRFFGGEETECLVLAQEAGRVAQLGERLTQSFSRGAAVGLCFRTSPELVLWWLGALQAGLRPLIVQYPTAKQSQAYWQNSVRHTIEVADVAGIICSDEVKQRLGQVELPVISEALPPADGTVTNLELVDFSIIQLSSGTTGHRKAVEFTSAALARHAADYQQVMQLSPERDMIVSWLPLYHDMGYVACFVVPLMLGIPVTMIDPEAWVRDRSLLFRAIEQHRGTVCYMPNFGFEVMSSLPAGNLSTMRLWISCSEPVKSRTVERFLEATGTPASAFAACYAMAENIFAVTQSAGLASTTIDGVEVVSCGKPIPGVELKIVEDEIWVRSPTALESYLGGDSIIDADGFYPTGDLGQVVDGQLHVTGRKRDLMIQAGKKFMLSDVDAVVNQILPEAKGRAAALAGFDPRLGTQRPVVLVEAMDFYKRKDGPAISEAILESTGLDNVEVAFVPPRFLTKTSSGKINRVISLQHWEALKAQGANNSRDWREEIKREFERVDFSLPIREVLDSLSTTVLNIILTDAGIKMDLGKSLQEHLERGPAVQSAEGQEEVIRIVSLADRRIFKRLTERHLELLSRLLGVKVVMEHVCLPPTPILLSDLVFDDYFSCRLPDQDAMRAVRRCLDKLRHASVIVIDDAAEFHFPTSQVYPVLSHRLERSPKSSLLASRWQRYTDLHHLLPLAVVAGPDLGLADRHLSIRALCDYLGVDAFRIASASAYEEYTEGWDYRLLHTLTGGPALPALVPAPLIDQLSAWLGKRKDGLRRFSADKSAATLDLTDLAHFCSHYVNKKALDQVLEHFDRFCIAGRPASVPYIAQRLNELGKSYFYVPSYAPQVLEKTEPFDCLLACGPMGEFEVKVPAFPVMGATWGGLPINVEVADLKRLRMRTWAESDSTEEWFAVIPVGPDVNSEDDFRRFGEANRAQAEIAGARREASRAASQVADDTAV
jgi:acyl-CoA synthetase (AMP-forming)/AMP-acid ligase II